jgi:hypothetical protein
MKQLLRRSQTTTNPNYFTVKPNHPTKNTDFLPCTNDGQLLKNFHTMNFHIQFCAFWLLALKKSKVKVHCESSFDKSDVKVHCKSSGSIFAPGLSQWTFISDFPIFLHVSHIQTKHKFVQLQPKHKRQQPQLQLQSDAEDYPHTNQPKTTTTTTTQLHLQLQHDARAFSS